MTSWAWWEKAKGLLVVGGLVVGCGENAATETPSSTDPQAAAPGWGPASNVLPELGWSSREAIPAGRWGVAAVVDTAADRLIVLGNGNDVWSLPLSGPDELQWLRLRPEGDLPPAAATVAVYDPVGNRVRRRARSYRLRLHANVERNLADAVHLARAEGVDSQHTRKPAR